MASSISASTTTAATVKDDLDEFLDLPISPSSTKKPRLFHPHPPSTNNVTTEEEPSKPEVIGDTLVYPKAHLIATLITPTSITPNDPYYLIQDYVNFSQPTNFGVKILKVCQLSRLTETQDWSYDKVTSNSNRMMLWHGTKQDRVRGILEEGFLKPISGGHLRFGGGIYFADRIAKSSHYCSSRGYVCEPQEGEIGYLFLCEVQMGRIFETERAQGPWMAGPPNRIQSVPVLREEEGGDKVCTTETKAVSCDSVKYVGGWVPEEKGDRVVNGVVWPLGATVDNDRVRRGERNLGGGRGGGLNRRRDYNEFIVYDKEKIKMKFLVKVEFKKEPVFNHAE